MQASRVLQYQGKMLSSTRFIFRHLISEKHLISSSTQSLPQLTTLPLNFHVIVREKNLELRIKGKDGAMKKIFLVLIMVGILMSFVGCGIEFFPDTDSIGPTPSPPPPGNTVTDVQADTVVKFLPYTVAGLADATTTTPVSVRGDSSSQYSINGGTPASTTGTVKNGDSVIVQNTSSNLGPNLLTITVLQIGGASATYTSTTGTLVFPTIRGIGAGSTVTSNTATVPATLPNGFIFGNSATISFAPDSDSSSSMFINGSAIPAASPSPIAAGNTLTLRHTAAASSGQTVTTKAVITGSNIVTYTVTFKSTTQ